MKGLVVIPAFNEEKVIADVLRKIPKRIYDCNLDVLVVDDGSSDDTADTVKKMGVSIVTHPINRGLGAALGTGFEYARLKAYDFLVTLDGDGQHDPEEIFIILKPILENKADFVVGSRVSKKGMPVTRRVLTTLASLATYVFTGVWTSDSQSGFRAFSKRAIEEILVEVDRMEVSTYFFSEAREKNLRIKEVSITPIYTEYSFKKGQNVFNSVNILIKLALKKLTN